MVGPMLLQSIPELIAWGIGIVLAALIVRRGGGKIEKLFLAGCCLMFFIQIASPFLNGLESSLIRDGLISFQTIGLLQLPVSILGLAGFVCLVWAFWVRFRVRKEGSV